MSNPPPRKMSASAFAAAAATMKEEATAADKKAVSTTTVLPRATLAMKRKASTIEGFDTDDEDDNNDHGTTGTTTTSTPAAAAPAASSSSHQSSPLPFTDACLHCHTTTSDIQVRCDECNSYICNICHWCHEFQANHEIRVCDRCDAFFCKACDDMDQCDDCGEVVCSACSTLLSCKFCGGGLCEECATACGRCGIVLCSRDAKFAVDCDTCRLSYCLVCLASGSKDPCVRCGHRPSKRMEQLVHLRLKSIYKAFKQSSNSVRAAVNSRDRQNDDPDDVHVAADDPEALFQAAANAAAKNNSAARSARNKARSSHFHDAESVLPTGSMQDKMEQYMVKLEKADAAAAELLAELEEEEEAAKKKKKSKKKKEKKKKQPEHVGVNPGTETAAQSMSNDTKAKDGTEPVAPENVERDEASTSPRKATSAVLPTLPVKNDVISVEAKAVHDPMEQLLCELVAECNVDGLEAFLASLKGIPGKAVLRKNAKKALKRLRAVDDELGTVDKIPEQNDFEIHPRAQTPEEPLTSSRVSDLLTIVSHSHGKQQPQTSSNSQRRNQSANVARSECVMHMSATIVGWVIGKGGQRIRDLMEESGARVWIDQESMAALEPRIVYVSGARKSVDAAVKMLADLVKKAPLGTPGSSKMTPVADGSSVKSPILSSRPATFPDAADLNSSIAGLDLEPRNRHSALKVSPRRDEDAVHIVSCDPRFVPLLIGRRGWTIKNIQDSSGARVDIDQTVIPRKITVTGSTSQVAVAVKMVNDVLDYPQSQLQGKLEPDARRQEDMRYISSAPSIPTHATSHPVPVNAHSQGHSSPPSSLVMPTDAVSASSSLSSTPEPSMASSSTRGHLYQQIPPGPVLPPSMSMHTNTHSTAPMVDLGPDILHQARLPSDLLTPVRPVPQPKLYEGTRQMDPQNSVSLQNGIFGGPRQAFPDAMPSDFGIQGFRHIDLPRGHVSQPAFGQPGSHPFPHSSTHHSCAAGLSKPDDAIFPPVAGRWVEVPSAIPTDAPQGRSTSDGFSVDAAVDFLQHSSKPTRATTLPAIGLPAVKSGFSGRVISAPSVTFGDPIGPVDESLIVDSLFGPPDIDNVNCTGGSALLAGLQGLSISKEQPSNDGLWGSSAVESQPLGDLAQHLGGFNPSQGPVPPSQLFDANHQHPPQSRFGW